MQQGTEGSANILDLTSKQTLFELAIEGDELLGRAGAKLIADIRSRAAEADYTHLYFRDPIRPGIVWLATLPSTDADAMPDSTMGLPTRAKLDECRAVAERVFPGFLASLEEADEDAVGASIPPLAVGVSGLDLVTALEYVVFAYPVMARAWAALIFAYEQMLNLKEGAESAKTACMGSCPHAQVVAYLLAPPVDA
jgi:hypothetical protein